MGKAKWEAELPLPRRLVTQSDTTFLEGPQRLVPPSGLRDAGAVIPTHLSSLAWAEE